MGNTSIVAQTLRTSTAAPPPKAAYLNGVMYKRFVGDAPLKRTWRRLLGSWTRPPQVGRDLLPRQS